jgi:hypothetical protein
MRKGQGATETVMVIVVASALLIPATYLFYSFLAGTSQEILEKNLDRIGKSFIEHSNLVYHYGKDTKIIVSYAFPGGIENMSIEGTELLFTFTKDGVTQQRSYNLIQDIDANFTQGDWSEGDKLFEFKAVGDGVSIRRI